MTQVIDSKASAVALSIMLKLKPHLLFVCLAALILAVPMMAQPAPLGVYAPAPLLQRNEDIIGLTSIIGIVSSTNTVVSSAPITIAPQLALITTFSQFLSPFSPAAAQFGGPQTTQWAPSIFVLPTSQVIANPTIQNEIWITGGPPRGGPVLYKATIDVTTGAALLFSSVVGLPISQDPLSLTSDGSAAYMVTTDGHLLKVDPTTAAVSFDLSGSPSFTGTPRQVALGPDGLLYVLDAGASTGRIVSFNTSGLPIDSFALSNPGQFNNFGAMAISPLGQLSVLSTDNSTSPGTLSLDTYDIFSGAFLGRVSGAGTFSADQGFNPGGHSAMFINGNFLYLTTGTGASVWQFSLPQFIGGTPGSANCYGQTVSALAQKYGGLAHAAAALGYASVGALRTAIISFCGN